MFHSSLKKKHKTTLFSNTALQQGDDGASSLPIAHPPPSVPAERLWELRMSGEEPTTMPGQHAGGGRQETDAPALPRFGGEQLPALGNLNNQ